MRELIEQAMAGRLQMIETTLTDGSKVYNIHLCGGQIDIACASRQDADKLFDLLDNTAYEVFPYNA